MPHKRTTAELQEHGQIRYRRGEYAKALELFTEAIDSEPTLTVSLLDNRAATYDKLGDITAALKDAKNTIRLHEKDPTGYVRAGKLLQKAEKPEVALGIYKHGIKKKTRNVDLLVKLHDKLLRSTAPPTACDPFGQLPLELVKMIMSYLTFKQIVYCSSVSKQWNRLIASLPNLWTVLDLRGARKPVKNSFITLCLNRSRREITEAHLERLFDPEKAVTALVRHCKMMHTLSIRDGGLQPPESLQQLSKAQSLSKLCLGRDVQITPNTMAALLRDTPNLSHLEIHGILTTRHPATHSLDLPNLKVLLLGVADNDRNSRDVTTLAMPSLLQRAPSLQAITLFEFIDPPTPIPHPIENWNLREHSNLQLLDLESSNVFPTPIPPLGLPQSLRVLRPQARFFRGMPRPSISGLRPDRFFMPHLEELVVNSARLANIFLSNAAVLPLLDAHIVNDWTSNSKVLAVLRKTEQELSKLRTLRIRVVDDEEDIPVLLGSFRLSALQHLTLTNTRAVNDEVAELIALNMPLLVTLDLSMTAVTGFGLKKIIGACTMLKCVTLVACTNCSVDAVEWARSKGVIVEYTMMPMSKVKKSR